MNRTIFQILLIILLSFGSGSGSAGDAGKEMRSFNSHKFNAPLELIASQSRHLVGQRLESAGRSHLRSLSKNFKVEAESADPVVSLLAEIQDGNTSEMEKAGFPILSQLGNIVVTSSPLSRLRELEALPSLKKAEAVRAYRLETDISMAVTRMNELRTPLITGEFSGQTGAKALIAVIDTGIDVKHADFRKLDGTTRIKYLWDIADQSFTVSAGIIGTLPPMITSGGRPVGTVYTESQINQAIAGTALCNSKSQEGHGNLVAGIAAGNGNASGNGQPNRQYIGAAPEADLIVVQIMSTDSFSDSLAYDDLFLAALAYIDHQATQLNRPVAINISLGDHLGAHDGTSLIERAIDSFTGPGKPGRVVVKSAGNDGQRDLHAGGFFSNPGMPNEAVTIGINKTGIGDVEFDFWFSGKDSFRVYLEGGGEPNAELTGLVQNDPSSGDKELYFMTSRAGTFQIRIEGANVKNGRFDAWIPSRNAVFTSSVERNSRITIPGTSEHIITVGSFNTKNAWTDIDRISHYNPDIVVGALSPFSSDGPTRDGRLKPEIAAPGQRIAGTLTTDLLYGFEASIFLRQDVLLDGMHGLSQGTSFSAPHVTGLAALLFGKNPYLDAAQIKRFITEHATMDGFTGPANSVAKTEALPDNQWGHGKLNAAAAYTAVPVPSEIRFLAMLDYPYGQQASVTETFDVGGWVLASKGLQAMEILIDGNVWPDTSVQIYLPRADVCQLYPGYSPDCPVVGFKATVSNMPLGKHILQVRFTDRLGFQNTQAIGPRTILVQTLALKAWIDTPTANSTNNTTFFTAGWAISPAGIRQVDILIDQAPVAAAQIRTPRADVCQVYPGGDPACPNVGFQATVSGISPGQHVLAARIVSNDGSVKTLQRDIQVIAAPIRAVIDVPAANVQMGSGLHIAGWAVSPYSIRSIELKIDGHSQGYAALKVPRPDVCAVYPGSDPDCPNVGFNAHLLLLTPGLHTLTAVVTDNSGAVTSKQTQFHVAISGVLDTPKPYSTVSGNFMVSGWVGSAAGIVDIQILIDGFLLPIFPDQVTRQDVCNLFPNFDPACPDVGFRALLTGLSAGTHTLTVRAIDASGVDVTLPSTPQYIQVSP